MVRVGVRVRVGVSVRVRVKVKVKVHLESGGIKCCLLQQNFLAFTLRLF